MKKESTDVLVIGAGPSGCVAASYLKNNGIEVKVVEKTKFPRFVIGESLIPSVMDHFEEAGLLDALNNQGFEKKIGARFIRGEEVCLFDFSEKFSKGWDWTWQIPRDDFDNVVAKATQAKGVDISFESEVTDVQFEGKNSITTVKHKDGSSSQIKAKFVIDCSGYGRVLPNLLDLNMPSKLDRHTSVFTQVKDIKRPVGVEGTQISFDIVRLDVWIWVIPFSNGNTSIGIVGPTDFIDQFKGNNTEIMQQAMRMSDFYKDRFEGVDYLFEPHKMKDYSIAVKQLCGEGYALTGNATEFLDPIFSSGVCFATESGMKAAKLAAREIKGEKVDWDKEYSDYILRGVGVFTTYVKEWYTGNLQKLFFAQPTNEDIKRKICAILAGYAWDETNPLVKKHHKVVQNMATFLDSKRI